jgi:hypothetical protein
MGNEFAEKKPRVKPDTSINGNKHHRSGADLFPPHLPLEQSLFYPGTKARETVPDRRSYEYLSQKIRHPPYENRQWTGAIGKDAIAHKSLLSPWQSRTLQENILPIFSINTNVVQRKGQNLMGLSEEILKWIDDPDNSKIADLVYEYRGISSESTDYQHQLDLLEGIKRKSLKSVNMMTKDTISKFLNLVDKEIALVKVQLSEMEGKKRDEWMLSEKRDKEIKQEHENKYGKSIRIYDSDNDYSEEYNRYLFKKKESPEYINEHYICFCGDIYYKDKKYTTLKQVEEEFEKAEKIRMGMGK